MSNDLASLLLNGNRQTGATPPQSLPQLLAGGALQGANNLLQPYGSTPTPGLQSPPWLPPQRLPVGAPTPAPAPDWAGKLTPAPRALAAPAYQTANDTIIQLNKNVPATLLPTGDTLDKLIKFADNTGVGGVMLTGGAEKSGHSDDSLHYVDKAVDIGGPAWTPGLNDDNVRKAALAAGFTHGVYEIKNGATHWHLQVGPGNNLGDEHDLSKYPMQTKVYPESKPTTPTTAGQQGGAP